MGTTLIYGLRDSKKSDSARWAKKIDIPVECITGNVWDIDSQSVVAE